MQRYSVDLLWKISKTLVSSKGTTSTSYLLLCYILAHTIVEPDCIDITSVSYLLMRELLLKIIL